MKVYIPKDRVKVSLKGSDLAFVLSPLTAKQKGEVMSCLTLKGGDAIQDRWEMVRLAIRYSLKGIDGITDSEDKPIEMTLDPDGGLSTDSMDVVMNMGTAMDLCYTAALQLATQGLPDGTILNPNTGKPFEDVEVTVNPKK